jgi:hypothetical protein
MSFQCTLKIVIHARETTLVKLIESFMGIGWALGNNAHNIPFSIENENGDLSDWMSKPSVEAQQLLLALEQAESAQKSFAVSMTRTDTNGHFTFLFLPKRNILIFSVDAGRRELSGAEPFTDLNWYTERIIPALREADCAIECLEWKESV